MGTRADFYVGLNPKISDWIGSIAYDGYPYGDMKGSKVLTLNMEEILLLENLARYKGQVKQMIKKRKDGTSVKMGWPWPWENSHTTDYSYTFHDNQVFVSNWGCEWMTVKDFLNTKKRHKFFCRNGCKRDFPDMTSIRNVNLGKRSGIMFLCS